MPEKQGQAGDIGEERLIALLKGLGWTKRGGIGTDITSDYHPDRDSDQYGIDGYMTYNGPFRDKERGFIIESKNKKWGSYGKQKIKNHADDTLEKIEAANHSDDFDEFLNFGEPRIVNTGVLGMWIRDEDRFKSDTFQGWVNNIPVRPKKQAFQILALGNNQLDRLASLHSQFMDLKGEDKDAQFFYPSQGDSGSTRANLLTVEYMLSDYVFAELTKTERVGGVTSDVDVGVVFFFDDITLDALNFMYSAVLRYTLDDVEELRVYIYEDEDDEDRELQLHGIKAEFKENGLPAQVTGDVPEINIETMAEENYANYADRLREELL